MPEDNSKYQEPIDDNGPIADDGADGWYDQGFDVDLDEKGSGVDEFGINHDLLRENASKAEEHAHQNKGEEDKLKNKSPKKEVYYNHFQGSQSLNQGAGSKNQEQQAIYVGGEGTKTREHHYEGSEGAQASHTHVSQNAPIEVGGQGPLHEESGTAIEVGEAKPKKKKAYAEGVFNAFQAAHGSDYAQSSHGADSGDEEDSFTKDFRDRFRSQVGGALSSDIYSRDKQGLDSGDPSLVSPSLTSTQESPENSARAERERLARTRAMRIKEADERRLKHIQEQKEEYAKAKRLRQQRVAERNEALKQQAEADESNKLIDGPIAHGETITEQVEHIKEHNEEELISRKKRVDNLEVVNKESDPNVPKSNSEKSLEELAREYPDVAPENLVKLRRSSNRCHLVSRTPVFDSNSNICMYELKFTAGKVFQVHALKSEHVYHVLFGYFIRRGVSCFIGRNKQVLLMMPLTYDLVNYIDRYSIARVVLRICPEQPVTPSALHILTRLKRAGMTFAIDLMVLIKKEWSRAIISIEYVMIDLSSKVQEQLNVFHRIKAKAPWLKTIGYNDTNASGYTYLENHDIDLYDGVFWDVAIQFNQPEDLFDEDRAQVLTLIKELFRDEPDYIVFRQFLSTNEAFTRDVAVFLYRFRHASPRQVQNVDELFSFLLDSNADRSFAILAARSIMLTYVRSVNLSSQLILQEHYAQAIIRGYFCEYMARYFDDPFITKYAFQSGMFSLLHLFMLEEEVKAIVDERYAEIYDKIYGTDDRMADMIECVQAMENTDLLKIFNFIQKYNIPPASVLVSYEKALMRTNELLLVLHIVTSRK